MSTKQGGVTNYFPPEAEGHNKDDVSEREQYSEEEFEEGEIQEGERIMESKKGEDEELSEEEI